MPKPKLHVAAQSWPLKKTFTISRGGRDQIVVVSASIDDGENIGRGECMPYARYGESPGGVIAEIMALEDAIANGLDRHELQSLLGAGAARNALDCAMWDLEAKTAGQPVWKLAGLPEPAPHLSAYTISLASPDAMTKAASEAAGYPLLKLKLGPEGAIARLAAVRITAPDARLIVDANEAWAADQLPHIMEACAISAVELIEQPLPAGKDAALEHIGRKVALCADESVHTITDLQALRARYDMINIKLDKTGGLTGAIELALAAKKMGFSIMLGCMLGTSLAMAPATQLMALAQYIDLDAPLLLARDRSNPLHYSGAQIHPAPKALWGC